MTSGSSAHISVLPNVILPQSTPSLSRTQYFSAVLATDAFRRNSSASQRTVSRAAGPPLPHSAALASALNGSLVHLAGIAPSEMFPRFGAMPSAATAGGTPLGVEMRSGDVVVAVRIAE